MTGSGGVPQTIDEIKRSVAPQRDRAALADAHLLTKS